MLFSLPEHESLICLYVLSGMCHLSSKIVSNELSSETIEPVSIKLCRNDPWMSICQGFTNDTPGVKIGPAPGVTCLSSETLKYLLGPNHMA